MCNIVPMKYVLFKCLPVSINAQCFAVPVQQPRAAQQAVVCRASTTTAQRCCQPCQYDNGTNIYIIYLFPIRLQCCLSTSEASF